MISKYLNTELNDRRMMSSELSQNEGSKNVHIVADFKLRKPRVE